MASPAKVRKEGEDAVEGFIYNVSPRRQSRNSSPFFTANQATFTQAEKNGNAVRLRKVRRSISFSDPDGFVVLCFRGTSVEVTSLTFLRCVPPSCRTMTIEEVKALSGRDPRKGSTSWICEQSGDVNGSDCELKDVRICNGTGKIKVTLWDRFVNSAEGGNSYNFKNLSTRERDGCICLCTGSSSTIEKITDLEVVEGEGCEEDQSTALFQRHN
ncbi:unnamed protein product [Leuciscus chuanchicus]